MDIVKLKWFLKPENHDFAKKVNLVLGRGKIIRNGLMVKRNVIINIFR